MKVLDLQCGHLHRFEGWFASEDDFANQLARGLLTCPVCGDAQIQKMLAAPRLNLRHNRQEKSTEPVSKTVGNPEPLNNEPSAANDRRVATLQAQLFKAMREVIANTEDVGERFADQARAMHHGDMDSRSIRGKATPEVAKQLLDEGIEVMALPDLPALNETLQ
jgi:hypothetical protein